MASKKSAVKRLRQSIERRERNRITKSRIKTATKKFAAGIGAGAGGTKAEAAQQLTAVIKLLDTAGSKGVFHRNTIARKKSRLMKKLNALA